MAMGANGLKIENDCIAGLPTYTKPTTANATADIFTQ